MWARTKLADKQQEQQQKRREGNEDREGGDKEEGLTDGAAMSSMLLAQTWSTYLMFSPVSNTRRCEAPPAGNVSHRSR